MQFENMNVDALMRAASVVVGQQGAEVIGVLYQALAAAMKHGYLAGVADTNAMRDEQEDERLDNAFDNGYAEGYEQAECEFDDLADEEYESGYLEGVADARARGAHADQRVADILFHLSANALNGEFDGEAHENARVEGESWDQYFDDGGPYNEDLVRDSGDEHAGITTVGATREAYDAMMR